MLRYAWEVWRRPEQTAPSGEWDAWIYLAGRGSGKTRTAAEWVRDNVESGKAKRIHLVARTAADIRDTVIEGDSGLMSVSPSWFKPVYMPSKRRLTWPNGAVAITFSAESPDALRGPQCLVAGTMITMSDGTERRIDEVMVGDMVATRNGESVVTNAGLTRRKAEVYDLRTVGGRCVTCTHDHRVFVKGRGFIELSSANRGESVCVVRPSISMDRIKSVTLSHRISDVYDIETSPDHEFFANGVLVHNCDLWWCDEISSWKYDQNTWDMLQFGARLGSHPRGIITTTPRPTKLMRSILADSGVVKTSGTTYDNMGNLAPAFIRRMMAKYEGTTLGRQELYAEMIDEVAGALWTRDIFDECRVAHAPNMRRIVVAIDPATTRKKTSADTGITVCGLGEDRRGYLLDDLTCHESPNEWAKRAIAAYHEWGADRIIGEVNNGGDLIETVLRSIDPNIAYKSVHASRGKFARAEPIAALYEQKRIAHVGVFAALEDQCSTWLPTDADSPDMIDALVWGFTELMLGVQSEAVGPATDGMEMGDRGF